MFAHIYNPVASFRWKGENCTVKTRKRCAIKGGKSLENKIEITKRPQERDSEWKGESEARDIMRFSRCGSGLFSFFLAFFLLLLKDLRTFSVAFCFSRGPLTICHLAGFICLCWLVSVLRWALWVFRRDNKIKALVPFGPS